MKTLCISYLKKQRGQIGLFLLFLFIFWGVLFLSGIDTEVLGYASLLSFCAFVGGNVLGVVRYYRHYREVEDQIYALPEELRPLPEPEDELEELYQSSMAELYGKKNELENALRISRQEMLDYYSLWAHQIKTPISAMHLLLQSQDGEEREGEERRFIRNMQAELLKTEQYVEMVLSYLRMEDMASDLKLQWYSLDDIIRQAVKKFSQIFIAKKIKLEYQPLETRVLTDEKWLLFVLEQILSNALKYTSQGTISIYMEEGTFVIEDTGIGIWAEDLPRVFEKGFTGYNGRMNKKSTGIGLYLCKQIMEKLGHQIWITSEEERGTKVYLKLARKVLHVE